LLHAGNRPGRGFNGFAVTVQAQGRLVGKQ
jgi:hypothetical protein